MTRIETLKAQVIELQTEYEKDMHILEEAIDEGAKIIFSMIDVTSDIYTYDVVCRMIYNQALKNYGGRIRRVETTYQKIEKLKTIIRNLEAKYQFGANFDLDYYNHTTDDHAKAIEECIIKLYYTKRKASVYSLGITSYTQILISNKKNS